MSTNEDKDIREFEIIEHPVFPNPSVIKMWVLLEGTARARKLKADVSKIIDLDDFTDVLKDEFTKELKNASPQDIVFFDNNNSPLQPDADLQTLAKISTAKKPLIVRYSISSVNLKVTLVYDQKQRKREIPHTSGSFSILEALSRETFTELEEEEIYFMNNGTDILDAYNLNNVISQTAQDGNNITLKLTIKIKGRKKYSDWKLKDVFKNILKKPTYNSLSDMPVLDMTELPPLDPPFNQNQLTKFVDEIKVKLSSLRKEFGNETKNRLYIDAFMTHAVDYIRTHINKLVRLDVEQRLDGSHGYGPVDYWVKLIEFLLFLCEAKAEDMNQGCAQAIVQLQSGIEQLNKLGYEESSIYGIASTGKLWRFIRWSGSSENPEVHISEEYSCNFKGELVDEKEILIYISQILTAQVYLYDKNSERPSKRVKVNEK